MQLILVMVTSLDGRSTKGSGEDTHEWTSPEDQKHFKEILENASLLIMGSTTYEAAREGIQHTAGRLRVVMTRTPEKYDTEKRGGLLEFTNESPSDLLKRLESEGYTQGYLVGGAHTNTSFFKAELITELWQTLEPKILGEGNGIIGEEVADFSLTLISQEKMNDTGTLLLKYSVNS